MRDLIPSRYPANTWRGFLVRVATVAIAALIVLAAVDLVQYLQDNHLPHPLDNPTTQPTTQPSPQDTP
ncbi:MAG: hypothetical protein WBY53_04465 [Acidobacteriaceae bacterium]